MEKSEITLDGKQSVAERKQGLWRKLPFLLLFVLVLLLPIFFVPSVLSSVQFSKTVLISIVTIVLFVIWLIGRLKDGTFTLPATLVYAVAGSVLLSALLSSLFSGALLPSLFGQGFEAGTFASLLVLFVLMFLVPTIVDSKDRAFYIYLAFFLSFFLLVIFEIVRFALGPTVASFGLFPDLVANPLGKWNDLAVFFGLTTILSLVTIEFISLRGFFRLLVYVSFVISLVFLALINFVVVWMIVGLFGLVFLVYLLSLRQGLKARSDPESVLPPVKNIPLLSLIVLVISLAFLLSGNRLSDPLQNYFGINHFEVRPTFSATMEIAESTFAESPIFGSGPNRFLNQWIKAKPVSVNNTIFWNTDFTFGVGFVPTFAVTTGILGLLSWLAFLGLFLYVGFKAILKTNNDSLSRYLVTSSFLGSLFLWIVNFCYIPSVANLALTLIFTGLFIASLVEAKIISNQSFSFINSPQKSFVSVLVLIFLLIGTVTFGYALVERYVASIYFQKAIVAGNREGNVDKAESNTRKALNLTQLDIFYRYLVEVNLARMSNLLSQSADKTSVDFLRTTLRNYFGDALGSARAAIELDENNYENWVSLGRVYESVVPLKVEAAYENAKSSYEEALKRNPHNPALFLTLARLELSHLDNVKAKDYIIRALQEKNNYTEAIFLLSQIQVSEGNLKDALTSVEAASSIAPNDPVVFFQLGLLRFNAKDYSGAVSAFERSVSLSPGYANAKYFLGLSYEKLRWIKDAIGQFTDLKATNPNNNEVNLILQNLKAGRTPFSSAKPPIDDKPEKRAKLPVSEKADDTDLGL